MTELVKRTAVGNFLGVELAEVERLMKEDNLPFTDLPGETRPRKRIFLPDFHEWLVKRSRLSPKLADFAEFKRAFEDAQPARPPRKPRKKKPAARSEEAAA